MHTVRAPEPDPANDPPENLQRLTPVFVFLQAFGGQLGLPFVVATMLFARGLKRHHTLVNFCATWIIYSIVYCLTIYNGDINNLNQIPRGGLCVAQAAMVHGAVPMCATAYAFVILQIWYGLRTTETPATIWFERHRRILTTLMLCSPYIVFVAFSIPSLVVVLKHPGLMSRGGSYYCTINYNPLVYATPGYCAVLIAGMLIMEVVIAIELTRRWSVLKQLDLLNRTVISMMIRVLVFSIYGFVTLAACAAFLARSLTAWPYIVQASLPTAIFLVFGTRKDILRAWLFWRRPHRPRGTTDSTTHCLASTNAEPEAREIQNKRHETTIIVIDRHSVV